MLQVLSPRVAVDEDVIEENKDKFPKKWPQHRVHESLKCSRSVRETKWHDQELKMAMMSSECSLFNILMADSNLVISRTQV
jgi:hypothetical protein